IGRIVYRHALSLLEQRRALYQEIDDYRQVKTGTLRIGISLLGSNLLTGALFRYHQRWPQIELAFLEEGAHTIEKALL
ncbi:MAG TPA: LysR family transcriptional regulator, partial [Neisseria sp.]|nr:LysR family transcriptional regulator [Neisseria sp.]